MDTLDNYHPWEHREEGAVVWVFVDLVCFFEKGSHIAQVSFELAGWLKTTLNFDLSVWSLWWRFISSHLVHIVVETTPRAFCTQANTLPPPPESVLVCLYIIIWGRVSLQPWFRTSLYSIQSFTHRVVSKWSSNKVSYTLASLNWLFLSRILVKKNFFGGVPKVVLVGKPRSGIGPTQCWFFSVLELALITLKTAFLSLGKR